MGIDMVNNMINRIMDAKSEESKKVSTNVGSVRSDKGNFNDLLKSLKSKKADINVSKKETRKTDTKDNSVKDNSKIQKEDVEEIEEVEEEINNVSTEQIIQCLSAIIDKIQEVSNAEGISIDEASLENVNSEIKDILINSILTDKNVVTDNKNIDLNVFKSVMDESNGNTNPISVINNFLEMLNKNNMDEFLDKDNLSLASSLINTLGVKLDEESTSNNENSFIKNLVSEVKSEINKILPQSNDTQTQKVNESLKEMVVSDINLEEATVIKNSEIVNGKEKTDNFNIKGEINYSGNSLEESSTSTEDNSSEDSSTSFSKDEKILNSILKGSKSNSTNTFNVPQFTTVIQNNGDMSVSEVRVINKGSMVADVIQTVKFMTTNAMKEMVVKINPNNLGEVTIKLIEENGIMKMNIKASSKETYSLLSQQANEMKNQLNDQNIKIQEIDISLYEDDTTFFNGQEFNGNKSFDEGKGKNNNRITNNENFNDEQDIEADDNNSNAINMLA